MAKSKMSQEEQDWWASEAERVNKLGDYFRSNGDAIDLDCGDPPDLNEDGSLVDPDPEGTEDFEEEE